jgi:hypothetical protein
MVVVSAVIAASAFLSIVQASANTARMEAELVAGLRQVRLGTDIDTGWKALRTCRHGRLLSR